MQLAPVRPLGYLNTHPQGDGNYLVTTNDYLTTYLNTHPQGDGNNTIESPAFTSVYFNTHPQGDGNRELRNNRLLFRLSQYTPARGRQLIVYSPLDNSTFISIHTRKGTATIFLYSTLTSRSFQYTPARGRQHPELEITVQVVDFNTHPQGDGNIFPEM